jgi:transcriptional regulator with XRE-family HTH domain
VSHDSAAQRLSRRAVQPVRALLGQRLRAVREQRGLSQELLGQRSGLSGKFIGEVERGRKSISIDSLYRVAAALGISLAYLTDVRDWAASDEAEKILALVSSLVRLEDLQAAYQVLRILVNGTM